MSPSASLHSRRPLPSLAFTSAMKFPFKASISPPSTTSSSDLCASPASQASTTPSDLSLSPISPQLSNSSDFSLSPTTPPSSSSSSSFHNCATPDWPQRTILEPLSSFCGSQTSSYISDEDLLSLDLLDLDADVRAVDEPEIPWELTKQPPVVVHSLQTKNRKAPPIPRRRSSPLKKRKLMVAMSPILEGPE